MGSPANCSVPPGRRSNHAKYTPKEWQCLLDTSKNNLARFHPGFLLLEQLTKSIFLLSYATGSQAPSSFANSRHMSAGHKHLRQAGCLKLSNESTVARKVNQYDLALYNFAHRLLDYRWRRLMELARLDHTQAATYEEGQICDYACTYDECFLDPAYSAVCIERIVGSQNQFVAKQA